MLDFTTARESDQCNPLRVYELGKKSSACELSASPTKAPITEAAVVGLCSPIACTREREK